MARLDSIFSGSFIVEELQQKRVDTRYVTVSETHQSGITVIMNYDQERANVTYCGAMETLTQEDLPWNEMSNFTHMHLSNFFIQKGLREGIDSLFKRVKKMGLTTSLDLQWDPQNKWDFDYEACLPFVDVFMPNEAELLALTKVENLEEAIAIVTPYTNTLIVKRGQKGSIGVNGSYRCEKPAFLHNNYVDSIGAGDSFNSGFIKKFMDGATLEVCMEFGNLMGALNTTAAGGTAAFVDSERIKDSIQTIFDIDLTQYDEIKR